MLINNLKWWVFVAQLASYLLWHAGMMSDMIFTQRPETVEGQATRKNPRHIRAWIEFTERTNKEQILEQRVPTMKECQYWSEREYKNIQNNKCFTLTVIILYDFTSIKHIVFSNKISFLAGKDVMWYWNIQGLNICFRKVTVNTFSLSIYEIDVSPYYYYYMYYITQ